jgi:hypothetical protein
MTRGSCTVAGCSKAAWARAYCRMHYYRWHRYGSPEIVAFARRPEGEAVEWIARHATHKGDACLIWPFLRNNQGYGYANIAGKRWLVTRYYCFLLKGSAPSASHQAAHLCGNGHLGCVNPVHLEWKTPRDNQADRERHGTIKRGSMSPVARLTEQDILAIRSSKGQSQKTLASLFGVTQTQISSIIRRKTWAHL